MRISVSLLFFSVFVLALFSCQTNSGNEKPPYKIDPSATKTTKSGLKYQIVEEGQGELPIPGDTVFVHYHGMLANDTVFDSSFERGGEPLNFVLGAGRVIRGWDEGIGLLKPGAKAILTVPAELGYGSRDMGKIPPNSTLIFHVQLVKVKSCGFRPFKIDASQNQTTATGLKYQIVEQGKGAKANPGDMVKLNVYGTLEDGTAFISSFADGYAHVLRAGNDKVIQGLGEAAALLPMGTKAVLTVPPALGFGSEEKRGIPANSTLTLHIEVLDVLSLPVFNPAQLKKTASGLQYAVLKEGSGQNLKAGQMVTLNYTVLLDDGTMVDTSFRLDEPVQFPFGQARTYPGWDEGLALLKPGSQAIFVVPPKMLYGDNKEAAQKANNSALTCYIDVLGAQ